MPDEFSLLQTIIDFVQTGGVLLLLVVALLGAYKRWFVFRPEFEDERADKEEWKRLYFEVLELAQSGVAVAEGVVSSPPGR